MMEYISAKDYDTTRLQFFKDKLNLSCEDRIELDLIMQEFIGNFFENIEHVVDLAVNAKIAQLQEDMQNVN